MKAQKTLSFVAMVLFFSGGFLNCAGHIWWGVLAVLLGGFMQGEAEALARFSK